MFDLLNGSEDLIAERHPRRNPTSAWTFQALGAGSNVTSLEDHRVARKRPKTPSKTRDARHGRAMLDEADIEPPTESGEDQDFDESGRRESNPRSQLGNLAESELADANEQERQVSDSTDAGGRPRTDPDAP